MGIMDQCCHIFSWLFNVWMLNTAFKSIEATARRKGRKPHGIKDQGRNGQPRHPISTV
jgi:hypothetical protein